MPALFRCALAVSLLVVAGTSPAESQEDACNRVVQAHCGTKAAGDCFADDAAWTAIPETCVGDVQTMIEMEREALAQQEADAALDRPGLVDALGKRYGRSYGGVLRKGPGITHAKLASIAEGERIRLLENSAVVMDDYNWYRVMTPQGEGYHWGGIFCSDGDDMTGVLTVCGSEHEAALFGHADGE